MKNLNSNFKGGTMNGNRPNAHIKELKKEIIEDAEEIKQEKKKSVNGTDKDCVKVKGRHFIPL